MSTYDLLTSEEPMNDLLTKHQDSLRPSIIGRHKSTLTSWTSPFVEDMDYQVAVWNQTASPLDRMMKRIWWSCDSCIHDLDSETQSWKTTRCRSCERQRVAHRTTKNLTAGVELLRRYGCRVRMITLTLPTICVLARDARGARDALLKQAKSLFKKAKRTAEWKTHIEGYLWSFECPVKWHSIFTGLMNSPNRPHAAALVPVTLNAHVHILVTGSYWEQKSVSNWAVATGHEKVADIREIRNSVQTKYALKKSVAYVSKEPSYGTPTRSTGGNIRSACQLTKWLYKNRHIVKSKKNQSKNYTDSTP